MKENLIKEIRKYFTKNSEKLKDIREFQKKFEKFNKKLKRKVENLDKCG